MQLNIVFKYKNPQVFWEDTDCQLATTSISIVLHASKFATKFVGLQLFFNKHIGLVSHSNHQLHSVLFIASLTTVVLSHRPPASAGTYRDSCRNQGHDEGG
jgi:hypothetical protein